jgi:CRISPR-associated protein Csd1
MSFRLNTDLKPVPCREAVKKYVIETLSRDDETSDTVDEIQGICGVTGEEGQIVRIHGETRLGKDAKSLVGIQRNSGYDSYGKEQGYNAPVIKSTEFAYVTALNTLLKSSQKIRIGNITTVFWSERKTEFENDFLSFFNEPEKDNPDAGNRKIKALYNSISDGSYMEDESETRFYILGLSPNSARIAVRIWDVKKVKELATNIKQYFDDFAIIKPPKEPEYYSLWRILVNISTQDENDNIPPNLTAEFMQSIINGTPFPTNLLQAALRRIRSDVKNRVKPVRAAVIKGYLNRYYRFHPSPLYEEVTMKLNTDHKSVGYQLGRLFAVLEKIQEEANPGLNATIRERYYSAACGNPITVFPILMKLKNHHLAKMDNKGRVVNLEKLLGEIFVKLDDFPTHLALHEQGLFAVGYYHQRQNFYE